MMGRWYVLGLMLALAAPAQAQRLDARLSTDSVTVGDRFRLTLVAEHPFAYAPAFPEAAADSLFGDLEVVRVVASGGHYLGPEAPGLRRDSIVYEVTTFALDSAFVPPIRVPLASEVDTIEAASAPLVLPVLSLVPPDATEPKDLAPLVEFEASPWLAILVTLLQLLLLAVLLYYIFRRRPAPVAVPPPAPLPPPPVSPYDEALRRLRALEAAPLGAPEAAKAYFVELSDVVRTYLEARLGVAALEESTRELLDELERPTVRYRLPGAAPGRLRTLLGLADLVKFADYAPPTAEARAALDEARQTINSIETKIHQVTARQPIPVDG